MKWTYSIQNKVAASAALFTLCIVVLFSNYTDRTHTDNVKNAINTLYADRLVVEDYILKMTIDIYEIKQALHLAGQHDVRSTDQVAGLLSHIEGLSKAYQKTKLTKAEDIAFASLVNTMSQLKSASTHDAQQKLVLANRALTLLQELSAIQLAESTLIMKHAEDLYRSGKTASQFAFAITIVILVVLQALVFASRTLPKSKNPTGSQLN